MRAFQWVAEGMELVFSELGRFVWFTLLAMVADTFMLFFSHPAIICGLFYAVFQKMRGKPEVEIDDLIHGTDNFIPPLLVHLANMVAAVILAGLVWGIAALALHFGAHWGWFWSVAAGVLLLVFMYHFVNSWDVFAYPLTMERNLSAVDASLYSVKMVFRNPGTMAVFFVLLSLLNALGALFGMVGLLVTIPVTVAAQAAAYRDLFGLEIRPWTYARVTDAQIAFEGPPTSLPAQRESGREAVTFEDESQSSA